jgi:hypothetical protein
LTLFVIAGLDPAIHHLDEKDGCAGTQTSLRGLRKLDCIPAHDGEEERRKG